MAASVWDLHRCWCMRLLHGHWKFKIPCRTGDSNSRQYCAWLFSRRCTNWAIPALCMHNYSNICVEKRGEIELELEKSISLCLKWPVAAMATTLSLSLPLAVAFCLFCFCCHNRFNVYTNFSLEVAEWMGRTDWQRYVVPQKGTREVYTCFEFERERVGWGERRGGGG